MQTQTKTAVTGERTPARTLPDLCAAAQPRELVTPQRQTIPGNYQPARRLHRPVFFVMNRKLNTAALFDASCFEHLQAMFRVGIALPDGTPANGIGRCLSEAAFAIRADRGGTRIQFYS